MYEGSKQYGSFDWKKEYSEPCQIFKMERFPKKSLNALF